jgi:uncharacterized protein YgfB (UPF0149 family)
MMSDSAQTYVELRDALRHAGAAVDPAELHGGLCASLCAGGRDAAQVWIAECVPESDVAPGAGRQVHAALGKLERDTWQGLASTEMHWQPLLPDDDVSLKERVAALAAWCHGFLTGLGLADAQFASLGRLGAEADEILRDFAEISRAGLDGPATNEADFQLTELVEYVRVGTQMMFEGLGPSRQKWTGSWSRLEE